MSAATETTRPAAAQLSPEAIAEWTARTRARQGLPRRIPAGAVMDRVIALAFAPRPANGSSDGEQ